MLPEDPIVKTKIVLKASIKNFNGVTIKGKDGEKGDTGATGPQGEKGKDGKNGKNGRDGIDGINGLNGRDGTNGKDGSPDTAEQIADKLNTLEEQVDLKVLKGWKEFLANLGERGSATKVYGTRMLRNLVDVIGAKDAITGQVLTKQVDGTFAFETPTSGGSLTKGIAEVDFGVITQNNDIATVSVADATVTSTSYPTVAMYALATTDHDPDDYMAEGLIPYVTNVQNGVGFDISVRAPYLTWGKYKCTYQF